MSSQTIQTMPLTQIIAFKSYLDNLGKPLNSTLNALALCNARDLRLTIHSPQGDIKTGMVLPCHLGKVEFFPANQ